MFVVFGAHSLFLSSGAIPPSRIGGSWNTCSAAWRSSQFQQFQNFSKENLMHQNVLVSKPQANVSPNKSDRNSLSRKDRLFRVQLGVAAGESNRQIAKQLGINEGTVR